MNFVEVRLALGILFRCPGCREVWHAPPGHAWGDLALCYDCEHRQLEYEAEQYQRQQEAWEEEQHYMERARLQQEEEDARRERERRSSEPQDDYERWGETYGGEGW